MIQYFAFCGSVFSAPHFFFGHNSAHLISSAAPLRKEKMKTNFSRLASCIALLSTSAFQTASAYPTGAGSCQVGPAVLADNSPHLASFGKGSLADGNYTTSLVGGAFILEATGKNNYFKGFLFRLSSNETSAAGEIKLLSNFTGKSQLMNSTGASPGSISAPATCAVNVTGACHNDNSEKTRMGVKLNLKGGVDYRMMITVVKSTDEWYYSEEVLIISAATPAGSDADTLDASPTPASTSSSSPSPAPTASSPAPSSSSPAPSSSSPAPNASSPSPNPSQGEVDQGDGNDGAANNTDGASDAASTASDSSTPITSSDGSTVGLWIITSFLFPFAPIAWLLM